MIDYLGTQNNRTVWGCICDCGNYKIVQGKLLRNGKVKSCGCLHNTMSNLNYTINGETRCLKEWCEILNLNYATVHRRIKYYNWSIEKALELEVLHG
nr:MAG TPA: PVL ORF-50-like family [Caudoviricetes sp.]